MKNILKSKALAVVAVLAVVSAVAIPQIKTILKAGGAVAVVSAFGKDINSGMNKLWGRKDDREVKTKVVVIVSVGKGTAIGAAQVMGPPDQVDEVVVVAQPEGSLMGVRMRALIPVSDKNTKGGLKVVKGVAVSGIVDLKL